MKERTPCAHQLAVLVAGLGLFFAASRTAAAPRPPMWPTSQPSVASPKKPRKPNQRQKRRLAGPLYRRALGVLGASYCYQTYLAIKGSADGMFRRIYRPYPIRQRMRATRRTLKASIASLTAVSRLALAPIDRLALSEIVQVLRLLEVQAAALERYTRKRSKANVQRFELRRQRAWKRLQRVLTH